MPVLSQLRAHAGAPNPANETAPLVTAGRILATVVSAGLRAAAAVVSGLLLCGGIALLLWSITPDSGSDAMGLLRGSVVALAAGHFLPATIGGAAVTIHPLLITMVVVAVIASSAGRARPVRGRTLEALHGSVFAVGYAVLVDLAATVLAPAGAVRTGLVGPLLVAVVGVVAGLAWHRTAWSRWWRATAPAWARAGVRAGFCAAFVLVAAGAVALAVGLAVSLPDAVAIGGLTGGSAGDAFGQLVLCLALLPNAVVAAVGYITGAGFTVGSASFSPLVVHHAELPAIPLLAATPDGAPTTAALVVFAGPLLAVAVASMVVVRAVGTRSGRLLAVAVAAAVVGALVVGLAAAAGGGVAGGPWSTSGVPLLAGGLVAGILLVVSGAGCAVAGGSRVPWREVGADTDMPVDAAEPAEPRRREEHLADDGDADAPAQTRADGDTDPTAETDPVGAGDEAADDEAADDEVADDEVADDEAAPDGDDADGEAPAAGDEVAADPDVDGDEDEADEIVPGEPADRVRADPVYGTELFPEPSDDDAHGGERPSAEQGRGDWADAG